MKTKLVISSILLSLLISSSTFAKKGVSEDSERALMNLISLASEIPQKESGCFDITRPKNQILNVIAMELASFANGKNKIEGMCSEKDKKICRVFITHANGEELSSAEFTFEMIAGKASAKSLKCLMTP